MSYILLLLVLYIALTVHEIGHALGALLVGIRVESITLGVPHIVQFEVFGVTVNLGLLPFIGWVVTDTEQHHASRALAKLTFVGFGPLFSLLLAILAFVLSGEGIVSSFLIVAKIVAMIWKLIFSTPEVLLITENANNVRGFTSLAGMLTAETFFAMLGLMNAAIAAFNLLPLAVLDGGRMLFIVLRKWFGHITIKWINIKGQSPSYVAIAENATVVVFLIYVVYVVLSEFYFVVN